MKHDYARIVFQARGILWWVLLGMLQASSFAQNPKTGNTYTLDPAATEEVITWERPRTIPAQGMMAEFKGLFKTLHGNTQGVKFKKYNGLTEIRYDSLGNAYYGKNSQTQRLLPHTSFIAWHPSWMTQEYLYYPYHLFSTIAFFSYDLNPEDGSYTDADAVAQWKTTPMIDSAKKHNVQVLLTLTSYGREGNEKFLNDTGRETWLQLSDSLRFLLRLRQAHGVDIDFSGMEPSMKEAFTSFVDFLRKSLGDTAVLVLQIPYNAKKGVYDIAALKTTVNTFVVKGFDPDYKTCEKKPVPSAPLRSPSNSTCDCIENTVDAFLKQGLTPENTIVSLPLYGTQWKMNKGVWNFEKYLPYNDIRAAYTINYPQFIEEQSGSTFIRIGEGVNHDVVWYEGAGSLTQKFQWIKNKGLRGAGLWGVGYDGNQADVWNAVATTFGTKTWQPMHPIGYDNGTAYTILVAMQKYKKHIGMAFFIIICFFIAGILLSCLDWRVRQAFFNNHSYRAILAGTLLAAMAGVVYLQYGATVVFSSFCYGILAGGGVVYIVTSLYVNYRKKLR